MVNIIAEGTDEKMRDKMESFLVCQRVAGGKWLWQGHQKKKKRKKR